MKDSSTRGLYFNLKILLGPLVVILLIATFGLYSVNTGYGRVKKQIEEYKSVKMEETHLKEKLASIKAIKSDILDQADFTVVALPQKNPATFLISQLKLYAEENSITIKEISLSGSQQNDVLNSMILTADIEGSDIISQLSFMESILKFAPISLIVGSQSTLSQNEANYKQELEISFYWSPLPTTLPSISEPIKGLTGEQNEVLRQISLLKQPSLVNLNPQVQTTERETPFN